MGIEAECINRNTCLHRLGSNWNRDMAHNIFGRATQEALANALPLRIVRGGFSNLGAKEESAMTEGYVDMWICGYDGYDGYDGHIELPTGCRHNKNLQIHGSSAIKSLLLT